MKLLHHVDQVERSTAFELVAGSAVGVALLAAGIALGALLLQVFSF